jgi:hypothetical protein
MVTDMIFLFISPPLTAQIKSLDSPVNKSWIYLHLSFVDSRNHGAEPSTELVSSSPNGMLLQDNSRDGLSYILRKMFGCTWHIELTNLSNFTHIAALYKQ